VDEPELIEAGDREGFDFTWITNRLLLGGGIRTRANMMKLAGMGITHIIGMESSFDDSIIAEGTGIQVCWCPCADDLQEKPLELFHRAIPFAIRAFEEPGSRIFFHCAGGIQRSPMMMLAFFGVQGMMLSEAMELISRARPEVQFPPAYRRSVARFVAQYRSLHVNSQPIQPS
jgi:protein-tyrosine phosphatase